MIRGRLRVAAPSLVVAILLPAVATADSADRTADYARLVEEYRRGKGDAAIRQLLTWRGDVLAVALGDAVLPRDHHSIITPGSFPAAIMLHTEAGLRLNYEGKGLRAVAHWLVAEKIARAPYSLERPAFLREWYHALGEYFMGSYRDGDAVPLLEQGRTQFPNDFSIALTLGRAYEVQGTFSEGAMRSAWSDPSEADREYLAKAEAAYRSALASNAESTEARLHLGRVLQFSRQAEAGIVELRRAAATAGDPRSRYLADLFIGDQLLHLGAESQREEARQALERALDAWPAGQAAALSLAQSLHASGLRAEAAQVLEGVAAGAKEGEDPFRTYLFGDPTQERPLLERVKALAQDRR